ncbi:MAG: transaldolase / glucose-6-phosphate isomerase, partial [Thermodesulfobacteriota bacterium]|nr:transaldolase / glucose-6-phosphate isomerase [Thermodesulfobacteriota bacterium]
MDNSLKQLHSLGQSVWLDNLSRDLLRSGDLAKLIREDCVSGITTNPSIFEKAITAERSYDHDIHMLVDQGLSVYEIYEALVVEDVKEAADLLRETYDRSRGLDGYVSVEVAPHLAYEPTQTVDQAIHLFQRIDRPNVMIKVPGTRPGMEAVRELVGLGINVNITLIFSREQMMEAASAYVDGMNRWRDSGGDLRKPVSVASLFVSRVDTVVDDTLKDLSDHHVKMQSKDLMGETAIANAKLAYAAHKDFFQSERFDALRKLGVPPQRIVWASTSTKNPAYTDTYYVDNLVGPNTVNTMPPPTLNAFRDHGEPKDVIQQDLDSAQEHMVKLESLGLDMVDIMDRLLADGLKSFSEAFERLLQEIATKRTRLLRGWGHRSASLGRLQEKVDKTLERLDREKLSENLWNGETSLWTEDTTASKEISQRLGWLTIVDILEGEKQKLKAFADEIKSECFSDVVILGMGGSSLAAEVFSKCFGVQDGYPKITVLDTTVPDTVQRVERDLDLRRTLFIVASKSGGTIEIVSLYRYFRQKMENLLGSAAGKNFIAITDPGTSLGALAADHGFRRIFLNPP